MGESPIVEDGRREHRRIDERHAFDAIAAAMIRHDVERTACSNASSAMWTARSPKRQWSYQPRASTAPGG
jgi:hypothetical protein